MRSSLLSAIFVLAGILLAAGDAYCRRPRGVSIPTLLLSPENRAALNDVENWSVKVDWDGHKPIDAIPIEDDVRRLLECAGWNIIPSTPLVGQARIEIKITHRSISADYIDIHSTLGQQRTLFTGAEVNVSASVLLGGHTVLFRDSCGYLGPPGSIQPSDSNRKSPKVRAYWMNEAFFSQLFSVIHAVKGIDPVALALQSQSPILRYQSAVFAGLGRHEELVLPLIANLQDNDLMILGVTAEALGSIGNPAAVEGLIHVLDRHSDRETCITAIEAMEDIGDLAAKTRLEQVILKEKSPDIRTAARKAVGRMGGLDDGFYLAAVTGSRIAHVRQESVLKVQHIPGDESFKCLQLALAKDEEPEIRALAARTLAARGEAAVPYLCDALATDGDVEVRRSAARALGKISGTELEPFLSERFSKERSPSVQAAIAGVLDQKGWTPEPSYDALRYYYILDKDSVIERQAQDFLPVLIESLETADPGICKTSVQVLGRIGSQAAVAPLLAILESDKPIPLKISAVESLGRIGGDTAATSLLNILRNGRHSDLRVRAVRALRQICGATAVTPFLAVLADDPSKYVRREVATALGEIGAATCEEGLRVCLQEDTEGYVREDAARALGRVGDASTAAFLCRVLETEKEERVRIGIREGLGSITDPAAVDVLNRALLQSSRTAVRSAAAAALGRMGSERSVEALCQALANDTKSEVRKLAATALGRIGGSSANLSLRRAMAEDPDVMVRICAATVLQKMETAGEDDNGR